ncbi:MAG: ABC transporter ATP-binding protein [Ilumatobacteraceae bacterium]
MLTQAEPIAGDVVAWPRTSALLDVEGLTVRYETEHGDVVAVDDVSFTVAPGERVALVGESGSGKSGTCLAIAGLLTHPSARISATRLAFEGIERDPRPTSRLPRRVPGMAMVFQDASTSLDPVWTIGSQLVDILRATQRTSRKDAKRQAVDWLHRVGLTDTDRVMKSRSYELSGGMRQRAMLAMALSGQPRLLIADEPTSALDASLSQEMMQLLLTLTSEFGAGLLLVSHDVHLCQTFTDRMLVMYGGKIVEEGVSRALETDAAHPYTQALLRSAPTLHSADLDVLPTIPISAHGQSDPDGGCAFRPRCHRAVDACAHPPVPVLLGPGRSARCWLAEPVELAAPMRRGA